VSGCASLTVALGLFWTPAATARTAARAAGAHPAPVSPRVEIPEFTAAMAEGAR
jgi:hypothetical protein